MAARTLIYTCLILALYSPTSASASFQFNPRSKAFQFSDGKNNIQHGGSGGGIQIQGVNKITGSGDFNMNDMGPNTQIQGFGNFGSGKPGQVIATNNYYNSDTPSKPMRQIVEVEPGKFVRNNYFGGLDTINNNKNSGIGKTNNNNNNIFGLSGGNIINNNNNGSGSDEYTYEDTHENSYEYSGDKTDSQEEEQHKTHGSDEYENSEYTYENSDYSYENSNDSEQHHQTPLLGKTNLLPLKPASNLLGETKKPLANPTASLLGVKGKPAVIPPANPLLGVKGKPAVNPPATPLLGTKANPAVIPPATSPYRKISSSNQKTMLITTDDSDEDSDEYTYENSDYSYDDNEQHHQTPLFGKTNVLPLKPATKPLTNPTASLLGGKGKPAATPLLGTKLNPTATPPKSLLGLKPAVQPKPSTPLFQIKPKNNFLA